MHKTVMPNGCDCEFEAHKHIESERTGGLERCPFRCLKCRLRIPGATGFGPPCGCKRTEELVVVRLASAWLISDEPQKFEACVNSALEKAQTGDTSA